MCGTVSIDPMPSDAELVCFYAKYQEYIRNREPNANSYRELRVRQAAEAKRQIRQLRPYLRKTDDVCEIGASFGAFLSVVRPLVRSVCAVEPGAGERRALNAIGIPTVSSIEHLKNRQGYFSMVALFHTIEHLNNPVAFLKSIRGLLRTDGKVVIETPNINDPLIRLYDSVPFQNFYYRNEHCFYFSPKTMKTVFRRAGFKHAETMLVQRYGLANHLTWLRYGRPGGDPTIDKIVRNADGEYRAGLIDSGMSDTFVAVFRK